ncbi:MAG: TolC family outer membrane protein [Ectothiorhodospiraceae bacterium]|jgi:outer membrane protein
MGFVRYLLAVSLIAAAGTASAADDLLSLYKDARTSDPVFQQAIANVNAEREAIPQARGALLPEIGAQASYDRVNQDTDYDNGPSSNIDYNSLQYGVTLTQPIYRYSTYKQLDQAKAGVARAEAQFAASEQDLMIRVAERYFAVLDARETLDAARANQKAIERQLEQARQRFDVGLIARTDVEEAKARYDQSSAGVIRAENDLSNARERLREIVDRYPEKLARVREGIELTRPQPADADAWRQRAEQQNWELTAARKAAQAAMINIDVQRGGHYPTVDARARYGGTDQSDDAQIGGGFNSNELSVGVQVSVPIYSGGRTSSAVREAQYRYTQSREALEQTRRSVLASTSDAYRGIETALEGVRALDQARTSSKAALEATQAGFEVGTRTIVDVLDAQRAVFLAERDYQQARDAYLLNTLRLRQAAGTLSVDDIKRVNGLLGR